jgi:carbamoyltransferase
MGAPRRQPDEWLTQRHMDIAASIQAVTEEAVSRLVEHAVKSFGSRDLCLAGGVALNCVANGRVARSGKVDRLWIQPAAGDAGGALGAALAAYHLYLDRPRRPQNGIDGMTGSYLGPEFSQAEIEARLRAAGARYEVFDDDSIINATVDALIDQNAIGWFQGRMEFGPRALGARSILGDPRSADMQKRLNVKVKYRESFRPFAPVVRRERVSDYFDLNTDSPYMLLVAPVKESLRLPVSESVSGLNRLKQLRSKIPAVTHVDGSARIQTVRREQNARLYDLLERFERATGCGVLVNTSFNVRGEPIICTADDAYRCFVNTEMDFLIIGNFVLERAAQPSRKLAPTFEPVPD